VERRDDRRWFEHFFAELSVEVGRLVPRYALWLRLGELGVDPARLCRRDIDSFCDLHLKQFLAEHDLALSGRHRRRLLRSLSRFDPRHPRPDEHLARISSPRGSSPRK